MGGGLPKNYSDEGGGGMRKKSEIGGGHTIFKLHSSKSHQPPYPIKNERSLNCMDELTHSTFLLDGVSGVGGGGRGFRPYDGTRV